MKKANLSAEIICIGTEILLGHIINTNPSYLSRKLSGMGIDLFHQSVVGDNPGRLSAALKTALRRSDIVITTGGLGPTVDDITISTISNEISRPLILNKRIAGSIKKFFKRRHIKMPAYCLRQAYVPKGARAIKNTVGTAPGSVIDYGNKTIVALPGPPRELIPIFEKIVMPYIKKRYAIRSTIFTRTIRTVGLPESTVNKKVRRFLMMKGPVTAGIYAHPGEVDIKITAKAENKKNALVHIRKIEKKILHILGNSVYGFDEDRLEEIVGRQLAKRKMILSVAESCTGGLIANRITNVSGSSKYFDTGEVTYSNKSKITELGVKEELIKKHGAVSSHVAIAMAKGMLKKSCSDVTIAVTGIAGPGGASKVKPVGLVYIALAIRDRHHLFAKNKDCSNKWCLSPTTRCIERHFIGSRTDIKNQTATAALNLLRKVLQGNG